MDEIKGTYTALFRHTTYAGTRRPSRTYFEVVVRRPARGRVTQRFACPACDEVFIFDVLSQDEAILRRQFNLMRLAVFAAVLAAAIAVALWGIFSSSAPGGLGLAAVVVFCLTLWVAHITSGGNVVVGLQRRGPGRGGHRIR